MARSVVAMGNMNFSLPSRRRFHARNRRRQFHSRARMHERNVPLCLKALRVIILLSHNIKRRLRCLNARVVRRWLHTGCLENCNSLGSYNRVEKGSSFFCQRIPTRGSRFLNRTSKPNCPRQFTFPLISTVL